MSGTAVRNLLLAMSLIAWGCGEARSPGTDEGSGGAVTGSGGKVTGSGGAVAGSGGAVTGSGGQVAGSGGAVAGSGGAVAGSGGAVAGSGGAVTGSGGAVAGSGGATGGGAFWPAAYDPNCLPYVASGNHKAGQDCLGCHVPGGAASGKPWLFAGTAYQSDGTTVATHVEIGVRSGNQFFSVCSATNGNFFLPLSTGTIDWANAEVRARNASGEVSMPHPPVAEAGCNSCHGAGSRIVQP